MFVAITQYLDDLPVDDPMLPAHREHLDREYSAGRLVASGPQNPRVGGVLVIRSSVEDEARALMDRDPLVAENRVSYRLIAFRASKAFTPDLVE